MLLKNNKHKEIILKFLNLYTETTSFYRFLNIELANSRFHTF